MGGVYLVYFEAEGGRYKIVENAVLRAWDQVKIRNFHFHSTDI